MLGRKTTRKCNRDKILPKECPSFLRNNGGTQSYFLSAKPPVLFFPGMTAPFPGALVLSVSEPGSSA